MKSNAVIENILDRRSVRAFTEEPVSREDLEAVVTCGQWAPSAMNRQPWVFVVVDDKALLQKFADSLRYAKMAASAPLAVVVCADLTRIRALPATGG